MGNLSSAGNTPPSNGVPSGPWINASQMNMSSSVTGPAVMPSGGSEENDLYSLNRRLAAGLDMVCAVKERRAAYGADMCGVRWWSARREVGMSRYADV